MKTILYFLTVYRPIFDVISGAVRGIIDGVIEIHEKKREDEEYRKFKQDVLMNMKGPDDDSLTYRDM